MYNEQTQEELNKAKATPPSVEKSEQAEAFAVESTKVYYLGKKRLKKRPGHAVRIGN